MGGNGSCMCKYVCVGYGKVIERSRYDRKKVESVILGELG